MKMFGVSAHPRRLKKSVRLKHLGSVERGFSSPQRSCNTLSGADSKEKRPRIYVLGPRRRAAFELLGYSSAEPRGKRRGNRAARGLLSIGRQAQIIAVLASMVVQMVELSVPYIWSLALDPVLRVVIRKIDVMQTLTGFQHSMTRLARKTYKPPKAKTIIRPNRCR